MQVEQLVREFRARKNIALYSALCSDEKRINVAARATHCARDREPGIEMPARASAGEQNSHLCVLKRERRISRAGPDHFFSRTSDVDEDACHEK
jgi:hypothetical protein